ncbi:MAG TPA: DNA repair protein RecN [Myxococcales bacterium]|nr:DNA repair protein RecN [Myxococcales bacterium]
MLTSIHIRDFALIQELEISLLPGLTVLTGETGAGKSIIVGALNLVLGDRANTEMIRSGCDEAEIEALFHLKSTASSQGLLQEMGLDDDDGMLVVRRIMTRNGRNRVYLNGRLATLADLRKIVSPLVDIASQHAHTSLLKVEEHRIVLDRLAEVGAIRALYDAAYTQWSQAVSDYHALQGAEKERAERQDYLRFQLQELDEIAPAPGEDESLAQEGRVLGNARELRSAAALTEEQLYSGQAAIASRLVEVERALNGVASADPTLGELARRVDAVRLELEDVAMEARSYRARVDVDPGRLEDVESRLSTLHQLMRKYGPELEDVVSKHEDLRQQLSDYECYDDRVAALQARVSDDRTSLENAGRRLREVRTRVALEACVEIEGALAELDMPEARVEWRIDPLSEPAQHGMDDIEILLSANIGETLRPLAQIASGGELSRIMLALRHVLAGAETVDLYVFDEIDTGVGGGVAERIGKKLQSTAVNRQVLCITHLPQVACYADQHLRVHKEVDDGRTNTQVVTLTQAERNEEIARLLAGVEVTEQARAHAAELLSGAQLRQLIS